MKQQPVLGRGWLYIVYTAEPEELSSGSEGIAASGGRVMSDRGLDHHESIEVGLERVRENCKGKFRAGLRQVRGKVEIQCAFRWNKDGWR